MKSNTRQVKPRQVGRATILVVASLVAMIGYVNLAPGQTKPPTNRAKPATSKPVAKPGAKPAPERTTNKAKSRKPQRPTKKPANITEQDIIDAKAVLNDVWPELAKMIDKSRRPEAARSIINRHWSRLSNLVEMKRKDPDRYQLYVKDMKSLNQMRRLGLQYRKYKKEKKDEDAEKIKAKIVKGADARVGHFVKMRRHDLERQLAQMKKRLESIERQLSNLDQDRGKLAEQFVKQALSGQRSGKDPRPLKQPGKKSDQEKVTDRKEK